MAKENSKFFTNKSKNYLFSLHKILSINKFTFFMFVLSMIIYYLLQIYVLNTSIELHVKKTDLNKKILSYIPELT